MNEWRPYPNPSSEVLFDSRGARRTASLFAETTRDNTKSPVLTLMDYEKNGLPSAYLLYMESETEFDAAMKIVGSMPHWRKLCAAPWFMKGDLDRNFTGLEQWRKDMAMRDANAAMKVLRSKVSDGDARASQFLLQYSTKGEIAGGKTTAKRSKPKAVAISENTDPVGKPVTDLTELRKKLEAVPTYEPAGRDSGDNT